MRIELSSIIQDRRLSSQDSECKEQHIWRHWVYPRTAGWSGQRSQASRLFKSVVRVSQKFYRKTLLTPLSLSADCRVGSGVRHPDNSKSVVRVSRKFYRKALLTLLSLSAGCRVEWAAESGIQIIQICGPHRKFYRKALLTPLSQVSDSLEIRDRTGTFLLR
jgi:hypothetical protein